MPGAAGFLAQKLAFELPFLCVQEELWREPMLYFLERKEFGLFLHHYSRLKVFLERTEGRGCEPEIEALYRQIPKSVLVQLLQQKERKKKDNLPISARLPNFPFALLGREAEKRHLKTALGDFRLVTLIGIGGLGKTRLAIQVAQEIATGQNADVGFLDLTLSSSHNLLQTVAATLNLKAGADTPLYPALRDFLSSKPMLMILDNCEHLIDAAAALCADLLRDCPHLRLLVTSREALRLDGEQVFPLDPLTVPSSPPFELETCLTTDAVRLFVERAVSVRPEFLLTSQNVATVVELCRIVDGLPLGIEMIASQIAAVPLERIAADLADCILTLRHRRRGIVPRHQTLVAALDWSYNILSVAEQTMLRRLAVFAGGWTLETAEQICSDTVLSRPMISSLLTDLAAKSLITMDWSDRESVRFHFLETVHVYARERLRLASERERFEGRYIEYFASLGEEAERQLSGENQKEWLDRVDAEHANFRKSLEISLQRDIATGLRLVHGLSRY